jgi:hypothetical protein
MPRRDVGIFNLEIADISSCVAFAEVQVERIKVGGND